MSTEFTFRDFLLSEALIAEEAAKIVTVDASDPNKAKQEIQQASRQNAKTVAQKNVRKTATDRQSAQQDNDATDPTSALRKQLAAGDAKQAVLRNKLAAMDKGGK